MKIFRGKGLHGRVAHGMLYCWQKQFHSKIAADTAPDGKTEDPIGEVKQFHRALEAAGRACECLYRQCAERLGEKEAEIFRSQGIILQDIGFADAVAEMVLQEMVNAETAVWRVGSALAEEIEKVEDTYICQRADDVRQVRDKVLSLMREDCGTFLEEAYPQVPYILAAEDLTPEEILHLPKENLRGLILQRGNLRSHTAILAKAFGLPAIMQLEEKINPGWNGKEVFLDGSEGLVYLEPDGETKEELLEKQRRTEMEAESLQALKGLENVTKAGRKIEIYANIASLEDAKAAFEQDAGGIGLVRSEFLYLQRESAPDEEEQYAFYRAILELAGGREVIVRTFDFGGDKVPSYLHLEREENPALGLRGVRLAFRYPELLRVQLRALFRAAVHGNLKIMYPMISTPGELNRLRGLEQEVKRELAEDGLSYRENVPAGIMIETPSAALLSRELAKKADFFSVGTNDLTQYTYAVDRQQDLNAGPGEPDREAVLRLIEMSAENAHAAGIAIGICGEMAADLSLTEYFLEQGIDELSVSPGEILALRKQVRKL